MFLEISENGCVSFSEIRCKKLRQNIAYSKESDQDVEGIENQILEAQLKELVVIRLSKTRLGEEG